MACWPSSLRRKAQSGWESMKKFSVRTAGGGGVAEEVEVFFEVGGAVGVVGAEAGGEGIGPGIGEV